jgi:hypothetical protein
MAICFEFEITGLAILHNLKPASGDPRGFAHFDLTFPISQTQPAAMRALELEIHLSCEKKRRRPGLPD